MSDFISIFYDLFLKAGFNLALFFIVIGYPLITVTYYVTHGLITKQFPRQFLWFLPFVFCCFIVLLGARANIQADKSGVPTPLELVESAKKLEVLESDAKKSGAIVETYEAPPEISKLDSVKSSKNLELDAKSLGLDQIGIRFGGKKW
jgi:hypothetical protein